MTRLHDPSISAIRLRTVSGTLETLPVPVGEKVSLGIQLADRLDLGNGWGRRVRLSVDSTPLGIVVDARGRPIRWPADKNERRRVLVQSQRPLCCEQPEEVMA